MHDTAHPLAGKTVTLNETAKDPVRSMVVAGEEFYLVFEAQIYNSSRPYVFKVRAAKLAKSKPSLTGGQIALKFQATIPDAAFLRLIPDVAVTIPDGFWTSQPIEVLVADPDETETTT